MAIGLGVTLFLEDSLSRVVIVGSAMLIAMIAAVRGMIQLNKCWKEEKNTKFMIALLGNGLGILYLISTIVFALMLIPKML